MLRILGIIASALKVSSGEAFDIENAVYDNKSTSLTGVNSNTKQVHISPNGDVVFTLDASTNVVYQYTIGTPWDISTASYANKSKSVNTQESSPDGMHFKPDGLKMYIVGSSSKTVYEYSLSTAWDVSTALYGGVSKAVGGTFLGGMHFSSDGLYLFLFESFNDTIQRWSLSNAWDITTLTKDTGNVLDTTGEGSTSQISVTLSTDGTKLFFSDPTNDAVYQYDLSTPWDLTTAVYNNKSFDVSPPADNAQDITWRPNGANFYIGDPTNDAIYQFSI